jgi:hypothetical protein
MHRFLLCIMLYCSAVKVYILTVRVCVNHLVVTLYLLSHYIVYISYSDIKIESNSGILVSVPERRVF